MSEQMEEFENVFAKHKKKDTMGPSRKPRFTATFPRGNTDDRYDDKKHKLPHQTMPKCNFHALREKIPESGKITVRAISTYTSSLKVCG